jgi:hypothetical protein
MRRRKHLRNSIRCRDCPFWAPPARCLDPAIKSGRCGDWIWYVRNGKHCRRRYARPEDPETLAQMRARGRFGAASKSYSERLTDEQQHACIAAGAKVRSRLRLGQSGPLTGQQYWVRKDYARQKSQSKATKLKFAPQAPQPQRLVRSTSGPHRDISRVSPDQRRRAARLTPSRISRLSGIIRVSRITRVPTSPDFPKLRNALRPRGRPGLRRRSSRGVRRSAASSPRFPSNLAPTADLFQFVDPELRAADHRFYRTITDP